MKEKKIYPWYFAIGATLLFSILYLIPSVVGMVYSFTDWNRYGSDIHFIGLDNFGKVFDSKSNYLLFIKNTLLFTVISTTIKTVLALVLAILFTENVRGTNFHRMVAFSPQVLSTLIVGLVFKSMLHPSTGFINNTLINMGLEGLKRDWLGSIETAFGSIIAVDTWKGVGYGMVIFIAGIQAIPSEYYEAAKIDGANFFHLIKDIMIPFLLPTITVNIVLSVSYGLRVFDIVYVLTNGGPGYATDVMNTAVFSEFSKGNYAMGSTVSTILAITTVLVSFFILKGMTKGGEDDA